MDFSQAFKIANTAALLSWILLALMPRHDWLLRWLRYGIITAFAIVYTLVVAMYFFKIEDGGFNTLQQVKNLMAADAGAFAGLGALLGVRLVRRPLDCRKCRPHENPSLTTASDPVRDIYVRTFRPADFLLRSSVHARSK